MSALEETLTHPTLAEMGAERPFTLVAIGLNLTAKSGFTVPDSGDLGGDRDFARSFEDFPKRGGRSEAHGSVSV
jgi:hypothetical protein